MKPHRNIIGCVGLIAAFIMSTTGLAPAVAQNSPAQSPYDPIDRSAPRPPPEKKYKVPNVYLRNLGLAFGPIPTFPNKCYDDLSISDEFLNQFRARGFSLPALCLAVTSPWVTYDPGTAKPLSVVSQGHRRFLVEIPGCFRNGLPFLDCKFVFDHTSGLKFVDAERRHIRDLAVQVDAMVRKMIVSGRYATECSCADAKWVSVLHRFELTRHCRMDAAPVCMEQISNGEVRAGSLVLEEVDGYSFKGLPTEFGTAYGGFDISAQLPRGYGYRIGGPEGEDEEPFRELAPGTKISVGPEQ
jgi:hypothetical protein